MYLSAWDSLRMIVNWVSTIEPRSNEPASNGIRSITDTISWSLESFTFLLWLALLTEFHLQQKNFYFPWNPLRAGFNWMSVISKTRINSVPVMAAVALRKKVVSIGHFSTSFCLQSLQFFFSIRSNQEQLYVLIALKIRKK